ncbi:hypothetical protein BB559_006631 [Furculomyces boomerangus]|uniref:Uncharacterized protein n=1 Tax=Furculomyces boomerangus TaxID=61424 RepID=A0A2T9Y1E8_9FUNG|nr:hypothetical protein BB559_007440 [Furculomyces boomerangus]PVU86155.1 hypothetical protein BB559_006631 [Furculomyces boomerangus]
MNKITDYEIISKIFVYSKNPNVRLVSRDFHEISTLAPIRARFLLNKFGKENVLTIKNNESTLCPNILGNEKQSGADIHAKKDIALRQEMKADTSML